MESPADATIRWSEQSLARHCLPAGQVIPKSAQGRFGSRGSRPACGAVERAVFPAAHLSSLDSTAPTSYQAGSQCCAILHNRNELSARYRAIYHKRNKENHHEQKLPQNDHRRQLEDEQDRSPRPRHSPRSSRPSCPRPSGARWCCAYPVVNIPAALKAFQGHPGGHRRREPATLRKRAPTPARSPPRCSRIWASSTSSSATPSAASTGMTTDITVNKKVHAAIDAGLRPIICVGESLEQRELGVTKELIDLSGQDRSGRRARREDAPCGHRLRAPVGHRHRQDRHRRAGRRGHAGTSAPSSASCTAPAWPAASPSSTAAA